MTDLRYGLWSATLVDQAVGAALVYWDLWNGSDRDLTVSSVVAVKSGEVAVTGVVSAKLYLMRTTAIGTGGTLAIEESANLTVSAISMLQQRALPTGVSIRLTPTGGATAGARISKRHIFTEEANSANYDGTEFLVSLLTIPEGTGLMVLQSTTASVGNIGFVVTFY